MNSVAVPLYLSRDLELTAAFYAAYWVNAWVAMRRWNVLLDRERSSQVPQVAGAQ